MEKKKLKKQIKAKLHENRNFTLALEFLQSAMVNS